MATKSKSTLSDKSTPATPRDRVSKVSKGLSKSDADSPSPFQNSRPPVEKSPRSVTSKPSVERRSPKISTPPDKKPTRILKPSELQAELNVAHEDLKKAKEKLASVEKEKEKALEEVKESQKLAEEANEKLREAMVAQKRAEENSEIEKFRAVEMEQAGIEAAQKKEEEWQKELDAVKNQHALDVAALLSATEELQRVKQELTMTSDAKNQALSHADDATKIAEIQAEKVEILSAELVRVKSLLESRNENESCETNKLVEDLNLEIAGLREEGSEKNKLLENLKHEIEALRKEDSEKNKLLENLKLEMEALRKEDGEKNKLLENVELEKEALRKGHDEKNILLENMKLATEALRKDDGEKNKLLEKLKLEIEGLRKEDSEKNKLLEDLKLEIETLTEYLEEAKSYEGKLVEKETLLEQLNVDLEASRMAESYAHNLMEEWQQKVEELEAQTKEARHLERSASESLESVMKQLEGSNDLLHDAESEIASLKEKVGLLEMSATRQKGDLEESERRAQIAREEASEMAKKVESLIAELETVKEEKTQAIEHEKLAAESVQSLLEEKNKLINELENSREEEEKSKKAMESLASALHEVSSEAREAKERLLSSQAEHEHYETQIEDLKLVLKATNEKYESLLDEAKEKIDDLTTSLDQSKNEHQISKAEWEDKELHVMNCVKKTEEENSSMEKEINRLVNLLKEAEQEASFKEEAVQLKNSLNEAESEVTYLKEVLGEAKGESMKLKESLLDKENEVQNILQENEELRSREAESLKKVEELSKSLKEALAKKEAEENGELSESEKDYDMLPKVVEFSEQNGGGILEKPKIEVIPHQSEQSAEEKSEGVVNIISHDEAVETLAEVEKPNGELTGNEHKEKEDDDSAEGEFKMWESCKIGDKDFSPERETVQEEESESKTDVGESFDQANGLPSAENPENGGTSPTKPQSQKKKKPLLHKFGSLLKKKGTSSQK
ncbi:PREDICTED: WEB family protein At3g02930, chloroplastic-like [Nicotiana attenuata]|uniref:Web family protein, chloroplastic n=1 Tax=Nicotiana attenuata TaxID=49451 RepID=A0A314LEK5_NICAT|nr:PREDICTED: WEB family protein At3g02930, chloroplastic-like [Nicotiana attenuata]OIT40026.1 web family protein, chloroplastic [Nicotiana attenuata]